MSQKSTIENLNIQLNRFSDDRKAFDRTTDKLKKEIFKCNERFFKEKSKIDNVIMYCKLIDSCSFAKEEILQKLAEIPLAIISYLKGESPDFNIDIE